MLFHSSVRKELSRGFGATLVVLATVVMTMTLIRTLGQASRGRFDAADVMLIMGYTVLSYTPTLLTLSLFIAIVATLSCMFRESEMVIWFGSGQGLASVLRPLMRFAWPIFAAIGLLSLLVLPWTNLHIEELRQTYENRGDLQRIAPGEVVLAYVYSICAHAHHLLRLRGNPLGNTAAIRTDTNIASMHAWRA